MSGFFKWLAAPFLRDDGWDERPRQLPLMAQQPSEHGQVLLTQEFFSLRNHDLRQYAGAFGNDREGWIIFEYHTKRNQGEGDLSGVTNIKNIGKTAEALQYLSDYERQAAGNGAQPVSQSPATWRDAARLAGYHIDDNGGIFRPGDVKAAKPAEFSRAHIDVLFNTAGASGEDKNGWAGLYDLVVERYFRDIGRKKGAAAEYKDMSLNITVKLLAWVDYLLARCDAMPQQAADTLIPLDKRKADVKALAAAALLDDYIPQPQTLALFVYQARPFTQAVMATVYFSLLQTGAAVMAAPLSEESLGFVKMIGDLCRRIGVEKLSLTPAEADRALDVMMAGGEPIADRWPLRQISSQTKNHHARLNASGQKP